MGHDITKEFRTVHTGVETIQGRKLFKDGNYSRKYGIVEISYNNRLNALSTTAFLVYPRDSI